MSGNFDVPIQYRPLGGTVVIVNHIFITMGQIYTKLMVIFQITYYHYDSCIIMLVVSAFSDIRHQDWPLVGALSNATTYEMASTIARPIIIEQAA